MDTRDIKILEIISKNIKMTINSLAEHLGVSNVTIRKNLDNLEKHGIIQRNHGYACLNDNNDVVKHLVHNFCLKQKIAKCAAADVREGETVMLGYGPCCTLLAEELITSHKKVTIITYSIFLMQYVRQLNDANIIVLGGNYAPASQVLYGPVTVESCKSFSPDKFYLDVRGFLPDSGFTGWDHLRVQTAAELIKYTKDVYIMVESEQFRDSGAFVVATFENLTGVYTDECIPVEHEGILKQHHICVTKAPIRDE